MWVSECQPVIVRVSVWGCQSVRVRVSIAVMVSDS